MQKIIIADASCLITLGKIGQMEILKALFNSVTVTSVIAQEFGQSLPDFIEIVNPSQEIVQKRLLLNIDSAEASAFALAPEYKDPLIILDDL